MNLSSPSPAHPGTLSANAPRRPVAGILLAFAMLLCAVVATAQTSVDEDLPGRVGRVAEVAGELFLSPADAPDQWAPIGLNYPVTGGDNLWVGNDGRAEVDFGAGQFRLAGNTNLHLSRLDDRQFALFVAQGRVSVRIRVLDAGEIARVDTPNVQIVLTRPGLYRIDVSEDRLLTTLVVREGEGTMLTPGGIQQVLPGQTAAVQGADPRFAAVRNGAGIDGFDTWVIGRDRRYERTRANNYVSREMVGWADLDEHGTWAQVPELGAVWYPTDVAPDWAPYRNGYWAQVGGWGPTWVDYSPWGYAPFHYGRWAFVGGRWGWTPGAYVARPFWAPALVGWTGGAAWSFSVAAGAPVYGWVPLGWGEPLRPWWSRCSNGCWQRYNRPYAVDVSVRPVAPPSRFVNINAPGGMTAMPANAFVSRRPVAQNMVPVTGGNVAQAPLLTTAPLVRSDLGRIPVTSAQGGAPPPAASNFYRTGRPQADAGVGFASPMPGAGTTSAPPATRPVPGSSGAGVVNAAPPASRPVPTSPIGGNAAMPAPAPDSRLDSRNDLRGGNRQGGPQAASPAGIPMPSGMAPAVVAAPPASVQAPSAVAPAQPSLQRAPSRPPSLAPAYVAPPPVAASPSMPPVTRQAPVSVPSPQSARPAPAPAPVPQVAPVPAPAAVPAPAGANLQRSDRARPDKVDVDKPAPK
jgi:hypothetical protein